MNETYVEFGGNVSDTEPLVTFVKSELLMRGYIRLGETLFSMRDSSESR